MSIEVGDDIKKTVLDYFGLKSYVDFRLAEIFNDSTIHNINGDIDALQNGDQVFWSNVINKKIKAENKIRLYGFQISSWFPRKPGLYWTKDAKKAREYAMKYHREKIDQNGIVLDVFGKNLMTELGGVGCVNFTKDRDEVLITATSSGSTQEGIPLICTRRVWKSIGKEFLKGNRLSLDIQGKVVTLPSDQGSLLLKSTGIPRLAVAVESILNIVKLEGSVIISVTPWTVFKTSNNDSPYGFTFATHNLQEDDMDESVTWLQNYVDDHGGTTIITDFDEEENPLKAIFPLRDVASGQIANEQMLHFLQQISKDFRNES